MSGFVKIERRNAQAPESPSMDSDVSSGSAFPSSASAAEASPSGWVSFSPQASVAQEQVSDAEIEPVTSIEPLDSYDTTESTGEDSFASAKSSGTLESPAHNGAGSFNRAPEGSRLESFERINSWRIDQLEFYTAAEPGTRDLPRGYAWRWLRETASYGSHNLFAWDEQTINALFSAEFPPSSSRYEDSRGDQKYPPHRSHFQNACEYGPPDWENKMLNRTQRMRSSSSPSPNNSDIWIKVFAKIIAWSQGRQRNDQVSARSRRQRRSDDYLSGLLTDNAGHSYHFPEIQRSIASLTSTFTGADTWDSTTSSAGMAAA